MQLTNFKLAKNKIYNVKKLKFNFKNYRLQINILLELLLATNHVLQKII